jgi:hypothetical protein
LLSASQNKSVRTGHFQVMYHHIMIEGHQSHVNILKFRKLIN